MKQDSFSAVKDQLTALEQTQRDIEKKQQQSNASLYIFMLGIFLVVAIVVYTSLYFIKGNLSSELHQLQQSSLGNKDYLEVVIPCAVAIGGAFLAFLGLDRLKNFDATANQLKEEVRQEITYQSSRMESTRTDLEQIIKANAENAKADTIKAVHEERTKAIDAVKNEVECGKSDFSADYTAKVDQFNEQYKVFQDEVNQFDGKYSWLSALSSETRNTLFGDYQNVFDVHQAVEALWNLQVLNTEARGSLTIKLVEEVIKMDSTLRGDMNDYHNLAAECGRHSMYQQSCEVCRKGLVFFKQDTDLLADWIQFATKLGDYGQAEEAFGKLKSIKQTNWTWRSFDFSIDYLTALGRYDDALEIADAFIDHLPYEDRSYYSKAELCLKMQGGTNQAVAILQYAVDKGINCPMCANTLTELYMGMGKLPEALKAAERALEELTQDQPSVNYGYVILNKALIEDRMALRLKHESKVSEAIVYARDALTDYQLAIGSSRLSLIVSNQADSRMNILRTYFPELAAEYPVASEGSSRDSSFEELLKYLSSSDASDASDSE